MASNTVEICANCGKINRKEIDEFRCGVCGCNVCVVVPKNLFMQMVTDGLAKE